MLPAWLVGHPFAGFATQYLLLLHAPAVDKSCMLMRDS